MLTFGEILRIGGVSEKDKIKMFRHVPSKKTAEEGWKDGWLHEYDKMHDLTSKCLT